MKTVHHYYVYILTNAGNTVLYVGVTNDLWRRLEEHRLHKSSFTARYAVHKLVYFEGYQWVQEAIAREKQLKAGSRQKKMNLINQFNPDWHDLAPVTAPADFQINSA